MNAECLLNGSHIEQITDIDTLTKVKALDDLVFGVGPGIVGISMDELVHITQHGAVFALVSPMYGMIAETQVITSPIEEHPTMGEGEAYDYGTAVHPQFQDMGVGQQMYAKQEAFAKQNGKSFLTLTIRVENAASIRARVKSGFVITGYDPTCYGPTEEGGARLWLTKQIDHPHIFSPMEFGDALQKGILPIFGHDTSLAPDTCAVGVQPGLSVDYEAHHHIAQLISQGYQGVGMLKPDEIPRLHGQMALIFQKHL
jgi:ribosomal protein S18 acetylase RimI-like enzyme